MNKFGIINSKVPIILAHVLLNLPFVIWFMITFFSNISVELEESAKIDGASEFIVFKKIILPLVLPGIAAVTIFSFMTSWNEYLYSVIFVQSPSQFTIPLSLATFNSEQELTSWGKVAAGGVVSMLPVLFFTLFMQKYLISGLSSGAIKE
jgi:ABC-type glycerol-3-phosphate transport system permease component